MKLSDFSKDQLVEQAQKYSPQHAQYVKNKAQGGANGRKGLEFETTYAAFSLARVLSQSCMTTEVKYWPSVFDQLPGYVDDLVVEDQASNRYHQLKNVQQLTWELGQHPLRVDFQLQKALSDSRGEPSVVTIAVVSSEQLKENLEATMPPNIAAHTEVEHFPYLGSLNRLVQEFEPLRSALCCLTRTDSPSLDELEYTFSALATSFLHSSGGGASSSLLDIAQKSRPGVVRLFPHQMKDVQLSEDFKAVLARIPNFVYRLDRGFFVWECGFDSGVYEGNCVSDQFARLQRLVVKDNPQTFEDLEGHLV